MNLDGYKLLKHKMFDTKYYILDESGKVYMSQHYDGPHSSDTVCIRGDFAMIIRNNKEYIEGRFRKIDIEELHSSILEDIEKCELIMEANVTDSNVIYDDDDIKIHMQDNVLIMVKSNGEQHRGYSSNGTTGKISIFTSMVIDYHYCIRMPTTNYDLNPFCKKKYMSRIKKSKKIIAALEPFMTSAILE